MPSQPFKKVDSLYRKETGPILEPSREAVLDRQQEIKPETSSESAVGKELTESQPRETTAPAVSNILAEPVVKSPARQQIESILGEDLAGIYNDLPRPLQQEFKLKGEETANNIAALLQKTRVKVKEIINLIRQWLKLIPGINRFFLEQEAKIKAD
ncbi:MAG: hypothetical protein V1692_02270, partial [bacterium]